MKIRLYNNSLRLRLSADDVARLAQTGAVAAETHFGPGCTLGYRLMAARISAITASLAEHVLVVSIPEALAASWTGSAQAELSAEQEIGPGKTLRILIEKDLECLKPGHDEPGERLYPHPDKSKD